MNKGLKKELSEIKLTKEANKIVEEKLHILRRRIVLNDKLINSNIDVILLLIDFNMIGIKRSRC